VADPDYRRELEVASAAAREAGALLCAHFGRVRHVHYKGLIDPVTEADRASEALIASRLLAAFPGDRLLGEEGSGEPHPPTPSPLRRGGAMDDARSFLSFSPSLHRGGGRGVGSQGSRLWIVDPLDGTVNFLHGYPVFCVSIALRVGDSTEVGVVYDPLRDELFAGLRGGGARLNGAPIAVSDTAGLIRAMLCTGFPYDLERRTENLALFGRFVELTQAVRRDGAAALDLVYVACGRYDGYWERDVSAWDVAAAALITAEAGGIVTGYSGAPHDPFAREVVASNGLLHAAMLDVIAATGPLGSRRVPPAVD
jgi:myo-inositol-1(or 4)-monophosphatase